MKRTPSELADLVQAGGYTGDPLIADFLDTATALASELESAKRGHPLPESGGRSRLLVGGLVVALLASVGVVAVLSSRLSIQRDQIVAQQHGLEQLQGVVTDLKGALATAQLTADANRSTVTDLKGVLATAQSTADANKSALTTAKETSAANNKALESMTQALIDAQKSKNSSRPETVPPVTKP